MLTPLASGCLLRNSRKTAAVSGAPRKESASAFAEPGRASAAFALVWARELWSELQERELLEPVWFVPAFEDYVAADEERSRQAVGSGEKNHMSPPRRTANSP